MRKKSAFAALTAMIALCQPVGFARPAQGPAAEDYSFVGADDKRVVEPGDFEVSVGGLRDRFTLTEAARAKKPAGR